MPQYTIRYENADGSQAKPDELFVYQDVPDPVSVDDSINAIQALIGALPNNDSAKPILQALLDLRRR